MPRRVAWRRLGEREAVGLVALAIIAFYVWSGRYWVDLVDEGYFLDLSQRVLDGALPYRDFTTYYTPGIFYLFALAFKLFGTNLLVIRCLMAVLRGASALLMYVLTRRVAPWPLAWLPFGIIFVFDAWPIDPEPHPSWPSLVACLVTLELVVRHLETRRLRDLALAGAAAGVAYCFKQNIGAFSAIGVAGYVLLRPRLDGGRWLRAAQIAFVVVTALLVTGLMRQGLDPLSAGGLWLPVLTTLAILLVRTGRASPIAEGSVLTDALVTGGTFAAVTLAWLGPLLVALGPSQTPLGLFVGDVNQVSIATAFADFTPGIPPLLLGVIWVVALSVVRRRAPWKTIVAAVVLSGMVLALPIWQGPRDVLTNDPVLRPVVTWLDVSFGTLDLYLPSMALWAGIGGLLALGGRIGPHAYYVLFGGLTSLTMYPRADMLHAIVSSPVALVAGAGTLTQVARQLSGWRRVSVLAALLAVPLAAVAPQVAARVATVITPEGPARRMDYQPLGLASASVLVPAESAADLRGVVEYVQAGTPAGQPLFVYPAAPLVNFLAHRPNPTKFDHFLPGTLTPADFAEVLGELRAARPRYVVWDDFGVNAWQTDPANRTLSDYIWACYAEVAAFHPYLVLERRGDGEPSGC